VSDLIEGIYRLMMSDFPEPVNLGNPREMTVIHFAHEIKRLCHSHSPIVHLPLPVDDPKVRQPNIQRARDLLNWEPQVDLETGLERTIAYFRDLIDRRKL
jgi:dTDP-glucose 4,6-dehydratase